MSEPDNDDLNGQVRMAWEGYKEPSTPPKTRHDCGEIQRPCQRFSCPNNLLRDDERAGRPHGGHSPSPKVQTDRPESCALDVADRGEHSYIQIGPMLKTTAERVRQLELRGVVKQRVALGLFSAIEEWSSRLPDGVHVTVSYPRHGAAHSVYVVPDVVITMDPMRLVQIANELGIKDRGEQAKVAAAGVIRVIRRRKG